MMLVLFDVDKTLFLNSDPYSGQARRDAIETVWGRVPGDAIRGVNHAGQTATRIAREILRLDGLSDEEIDRASNDGARGLWPLPRPAR